MRTPGDWTEVPLFGLDEGGYALVQEVAPALLTDGERRETTDMRVRLLPMESET